MKKVFVFVALFAISGFSEIFEFVNVTTECIIHFNSFNGEFDYSKECNYRNGDEDLFLMTCYFDDESKKSSDPNYARIWQNDEGPQFELKLFNGKSKKYTAKNFTDDLRKEAFRKCDFHYEAHIQKAANEIDKE